VKYALGKVESVRGTMSLKRIRTTEVLCFDLWSRAPIKGVISGVTTYIKVEDMDKLCAFLSKTRTFLRDPKLLNGSAYQIPTQAQGKPGRAGLPAPVSLATLQM
jgi:hypothetical protein